MVVQNNIDLAPYNTFHIAHKARTMVWFSSVNDLHHLAHMLNDDYIVMGAGSNMLITRDLEELILINAVRGRTIVKDNDSDVLVHIGGGENWHDIVLWAVNEDFGGIENLALIPGTVGAAPIQNIGAYGKELSDVLHCVYAYDTKTDCQVNFHRLECGFDYRYSHFKGPWKGRYIITGVVLRLTKPGHHAISSDYWALEKELEDMGVTDPSIGDIADAVIAVRQSKLPDPAKLGNAGSFFKNPIVPQSHFNKLLTSFPELPSYPAGNDQVKIPAGWLIDKAGWKGYREGHVGVHRNQALVLVNYGGGSGADILALANSIRRNILEIYDIDLEPEVNIIQ